MSMGVLQLGEKLVARLRRQPTPFTNEEEIDLEELLYSTMPGALLVPQRAVSELQGVYQVAVVGGDNKVNIRAWPRRSSSR